MNPSMNEIRNEPRRGIELLFGIALATISRRTVMASSEPRPNETWTYIISSFLNVNLNLKKIKSFETFVLKSQSSKSDVSNISFH